MYTQYLYRTFNPVGAGETFLHPTPSPEYFCYYGKSKSMQIAKIVMQTHAK